MNSVFELFKHRPDLGIIASQHFEPMRHWVNWGGNFKIASALANQMGIALSEDAILDFPSGSMFWARSSALRPLLDVGLTFEDFSEEPCEIDGTLAHAIERIYYFVCERAAFKWIKISQPTLFEQTPAIVHIDCPEAIDFFLSTHALTLTAPSRLMPRTIAPLPITSAAPNLVLRLQDSALGYGQQLGILSALWWVSSHTTILKLK